MRRARKPSGRRDQFDFGEDAGRPGRQADPSGCRTRGRRSSQPSLPAPWCSSTCRSGRQGREGRCWSCPWASAAFRRRAVGAAFLQGKQLRHPSVAVRSRTRKPARNTATDARRLRKGARTGVTGGPNPPQTAGTLFPRALAARGGDRAGAHRPRFAERCGTTRQGNGAPAAGPRARTRRASRSASSGGLLPGPSQHPADARRASLSQWVRRRRGSA